MPKPRKAKKHVPLEKDIQKQISDWLKLHGATVVRVNSGAMKVGNRFIKMNSEEGCSDLLVCWKGLFLAVECKRPKNEATDKQQLFLDKVTKSGGIAIVATCIEDVAIALEMLKPE